MTHSDMAAQVADKFRYRYNTCQRQNCAVVVEIDGWTHTLILDRDQVGDNYNNLEALTAAMIKNRRYKAR